MLLGAAFGGGCENLNFDRFNLIVSKLLQRLGSSEHPTYDARMPSTSTDGKICYIEMPAVDVRRSAEFYEKVFGWRIRKRGDGATAFDDATGQVSGAWVLGRPASQSPGLLVYIMVDSVERTIEKLKSAGGELVQPIGADAPEITARFRDPGGNVIGLYQEPNRPMPAV
jgi:predicted enzyme related to lactoylglutathione lyase